MANEDNKVVVVSTGDQLRKLLGPPASSSESDAEPKLVTTEHEVTIAGQRVPYAATCGTLEVRVDDPEKPTERVFYTAYVRSDVEDLGERPVTFCFNGGPGSSSVWLHMGCFGPRRVRVDAGARPKPPALAEDHARSILDVTDLVFVDPVGTGFSRPDSGDGEAYFGVDGDVESVGEFVRRYVTVNGRWASPKYVAGESYGTTRAAGLASYLQDRYGLFLNGLILLSTALQFQCLAFDAGNDLPYALYLPGYAATAAYHGLVQPDDLSAFLAEAERFAIERYLPALARGSRLAEDERQAVAQELARFTGLSATYIRNCNLRIHLMRFCRELLRDTRRTVGRLDSRFTGEEFDAAGESITRDPSMAALTAAYGSAFLHDLRTRLKYDDDDVYELLNYKTHKKWKWSANNEYLDVTGKLRQAMLDNPHLRVFVASGLYDLATPAFATDYTLAHMFLETEAPTVIRHVVYPAGHMMYIHEPSMDALRGDLLAFFEGAPT